MRATELAIMILIKKHVSKKTRMESKEDDSEENQRHPDEDEYDSELDTLPPRSVMMEEVDRSIEQVSVPPAKFYINIDFCTHSLPVAVSRVLPSVRG